MPYKDKEKAREYNKKWYQEHSGYMKKYGLEHKKEIAEKKKKYIEKYKGHIGKRGIKNPNWYAKRISTWKQSGIKLINPYRTYWEMYSVFYIQANRKCEICSKPLRLWYSEGISPLKYKNIMPAQLDHDHKTGIPRGILCTNCNYVVGIVERRLNGNAKNISKYINKQLNFNS